MRREVEGTKVVGAGGRFEQRSRAVYGNRLAPWKLAHPGGPAFSPLTENVRLCYLTDGSFIEIIISDHDRRGSCISNRLQSSRLRPWNSTTWEGWSPNCDSVTRLDYRPPNTYFPWAVHFRPQIVSNEDVPSLLPPPTPFNNTGQLKTLLAAALLCGYPTRNYSLPRSLWPSPSSTYSLTELKSLAIVSVRKKEIRSSAPRQRLTNTTTSLRRFGHSLNQPLAPSQQALLSEHRRIRMRWAIKLAAPMPTQFSHLSRRSISGISVSFK